MDIKLLRPDCYKTSKWSGGTTTEIFIYPEGASYAERRFGAMISSASVDDEVSVFTPLPGVKRFISPLTGSFELTHEPGGKHIVLPGRVHAFDGGISTGCVGKVTDFNLMLKRMDGSLFSASGKGSCSCAGGYMGLFAVKPACVKAGEKAYVLAPGETLLISSEKAFSAEFDGELLMVFTFSE